MSRQPFPHPEKIIDDLLKFELTLIEVAIKNRASETTIRRLADRNGIDLNLRMRIVRIFARLKSLDEEFSGMSRSFYETYDKAQRELTSQDLHAP